MKYHHLATLVIVWWIGAALASLALFLPNYNHFFTVGIVGWSTIMVSSGLIAYEIRRIKAEDRKKEIQNG